MWACLFILGRFVHFEAPAVGGRAVQIIAVLVTAVGALIGCGVCVSLVIAADFLIRAAVSITRRAAKCVGARNSRVASKDNTGV